MSSGGELVDILTSSTTTTCNSSDDDDDDDSEIILPILNIKGKELYVEEEEEEEEEELIDFIPTPRIDWTAHIDVEDNSSKSKSSRLLGHSKRNKNSSNKYKGIKRKIKKVICIENENYPQVSYDEEKKRKEGDDDDDDEEEEESDYNDDINTSSCCSSNYSNRNNTKRKIHNNNNNNFSFKESCLNVYNFAISTLAEKREKNTPRREPKDTRWIHTKRFETTDTSFNPFLLFFKKYKVQHIFEDWRYRLGAIISGILVLIGGIVTFGLTGIVMTQHIGITSLFGLLPLISCIFSFIIIFFWIPQKFIPSPFKCISFYSTTRRKFATFFMYINYSCLLLYWLWGGEWTGIAVKGPAAIIVMAIYYLIVPILSVRFLTPITIVVILFADIGWIINNDELDVNSFYAAMLILPVGLIFITFTGWSYERILLEKYSLLIQLHEEKRRSLLLVEAMLPAPVAKSLIMSKEQGKSLPIVPERFNNVSVIFVEVMGFQKISMDLEPEQLVEFLSKIYVHWDQMTGEDSQVFKVENVGNTYMMATGIFPETEDHAIIAAEFCLKLKSQYQQNKKIFTTPTGDLVNIRMGINSGPVAAGITGTTKFAYHLFGNTVNTASRMESTAPPGGIQISPSTYKLIHSRTICSSRGLIDIKGKGMMHLHLVHKIVYPPTEGYTYSQDEGIEYDEHIIEDISNINNNNNNNNNEKKDEDISYSATKGVKKTYNDVASDIKNTTNKSLLSGTHRVSFFSLQFRKVQVESEYHRFLSTKYRHITRGILIMLLLLNTFGLLPLDIYTAITDDDIFDWGPVSVGFTLFSIYTVRTILPLYSILRSFFGNRGYRNADFIVGLTLFFYGVSSSMLDVAFAGAGLQSAVTVTVKAVILVAYFITPVTTWSTAVILAWLDFALWIGTFASNVNKRSNFLNDAVPNTFWYPFLCLGLTLTGYIDERSKRAIFVLERLVVNYLTYIEELVGTLLPLSIAKELLHSERAFLAQRYNEVTILFSDIVGFTALSSTMDPEELFALLNDLYSAFDRLAKKYGLYKIDIIGDAYVCVAGLPDTHPLSVEAMVEMATAMHIEITRVASDWDRDVKMRIGLHTGPAEAGVIGIASFRFAVWGETLLLAEKMESNGEANRIHVSNTTRKILEKSSIPLEYEFSDERELDLGTLGIHRSSFVQRRRISTIKVHFKEETPTTKEEKTRTIGRKMSLTKFLEKKPSL